MGTLLRLHAARWEDASAAFEPELEAFHREFAAVALERGWLRLWICRGGREPRGRLVRAALRGLRVLLPVGPRPGLGRAFRGLRPARPQRSAPRSRTGCASTASCAGGDAYKGRFADGDPGVETMVARPRLARPARRGRRRRSRAPARAATACSPARTAGSAPLHHPAATSSRIGPWRLRSAQPSRCEEDRERMQLARHAVEPVGHRQRLERLAGRGARRGAGSTRASARPHRVAHQRPEHLGQALAGGEVPHPAARERDQVEEVDQRKRVARGPLPVEHRVEPAVAHEEVLDSRSRRGPARAARRRAAARGSATIDGGAPRARRRSRSSAMRSPCVGEAPLRGHRRARRGRAERARRGTRGAWSHRSAVMRQGCVPVAFGSSE